jgi:hypothetical protein
MDLAVIIFVSAVCGASSSILMQLIGRRISSTPPHTTLPTNTTESIHEASGNSVGIDSQTSDLQNEDKETNPSPPFEESIIENKEVQKDYDTHNLKEEVNEEVNEEDIITGSNLSHHIPKLARFQDLNIPSLDEDISLSDTEILRPETNNIVPSAKEKYTSSIQSVPNTVPIHPESDDDATVLVERIPPK